MATKYLTKADVTTYTATYNSATKDFTYTEDSLSESASDRKKYLLPSDRYPISSTSSPLTFRDLYYKSSERSDIYIDDNQYITTQSFKNNKLIFSTLGSIGGFSPSWLSDSTKTQIVTLYYYTTNSAKTTIGRTLTITFTQLACLLRFLGKKLTFSPVTRSYPMCYYYSINSSAYVGFTSLNATKQTSQSLSYIRYNYSSANTDDFEVRWRKKFDDSSISDTAVSTFEIWLVAPVKYDAKRNILADLSSNNFTMAIRNSGNSKHLVGITIAKGVNGVIALTITSDSNNLTSCGYTLTTSTATYPTTCQIAPAYCKGTQSSPNGASIRATITLTASKTFTPKVTTITTT